MVVADEGYVSASDIVECVDSGFEVHVAGDTFDVCVPCREEQAREVLSRINGRCVYLESRNLVICPMGQVLYPGNYTKTTREVAFYNSVVCRSCGCKCTRADYRRFSIVLCNGSFSKVCNSAGLVVRSFRVRADKELVGLRKCLCEHPFGVVKRGFGMGYCLLRGIGRVRGEFSLAFLAYNLRRVINIVGVSKLLSVIQS